MPNDLIERSPQTRPHLLPVQLLIGAATAPMLAVLVGGKLVAKTLTEMGWMSEEVFRGDRLPVLHFPPTSPPSEPD